MSEEGKEKSLREYVGSALHANVGYQLLPSQLYRFFADLEGPTISYHLKRCKIYLNTLQRLAGWNNSLSLAWLADAQGQREEQIGCVTRIVRTFSRDFKTPQQWSQIIDSIMSCVGSQGALDAIEEKDVARLVLEGALRISDMRVLSFVMREHSMSQLTDSEREDIILNASREFYDNATSTNLHSGDMKVAYEILSQYGPPTTSRIEQEKAFIEASSRLCSFKVQSALRPGVLLAPIEIRLSQDRLDFIKRLLENREEAYKTPDLVLEMAMKLCSVPSGGNPTTTSKEDKGSDPSSTTTTRTLIESKTLALLTEAALGQGDYSQAQISCQRLISNITALSKRVEQSAASNGSQHDHLRELFNTVSEITYRTCFILCNQQDWNDYSNRLRWCSYVLAYCPNEQVEKYLKTWRQLERQFQNDLLVNPPKDWDQLTVQLLKSNSGQSGLLTGGLSSSLASIGGGLGAFESLSPFSTLFASTGLSALSRGSSTPDQTTSTTSPIVKDNSPLPSAKVNNSSSPTSRAARLFDSLGTSNDQVNTGYLDPAERAARAARRFFGGFGS